MINKGFTLLELLIVVAIIAVLVGATMPYFENYVRDAKITKAKHELDVLKEALIKFETIEDKKYTATTTSFLIGRYIQNITRDPWGRDYEVDPSIGIVKSRGPDNQNPADDIIVDYKPPLTLNKAVWIDSDNDQHITTSDYIRLEFTRYMVPGNSLRYGTNPNADIDLLFSSDVITTELVATQTPTSSTYILIPISANNDNLFFPGSSTVQVASANNAIVDFSGKRALGSNGTFGALPVIIQPN